MKERQDLAMAMSLIPMAVQQGFDLKLNRMNGIRSLAKQIQEQWQLRRIF